MSGLCGLKTYSLFCVLTTLFYMYLLICLFYVCFLVQKMTLRRFFY